MAAAVARRGKEKMPVQSQIIQCPAGVWTSIAQLMPRRRSLMVQCPESATSLLQASVGILTGGTSQLCAANQLRKSVIFAAGDVSRDLMVAPSAAPSNFDSLCIQQSVVPGQLPALVISESTYGAWARSLWACLNNGALNATVLVMQEVYTCRAIILGIKADPVTYTGPFGAAPAGIWTSPDLAAGGATFRLNSVADADLTIQEWFAWPVGSGTIGVQVFQAFDDAPPISEDTYTTFDVGLPQLSSLGKFHLDSLRRKIGGAAAALKIFDGGDE